MNKVISLEAALDYIKDGMTLMIGGFGGRGTPENIIDALVAKNIKNLTIISNDTGFTYRGVGKLVVNKQVKKVFASHVGTNPETGRQMNEGDLEVELIPQGTLVERIRCGGAGIGGFLTKTGVGTKIEEGKRVITIDDDRYLLETPLRADVALLRASIADTHGNVFYNGATRNFNPIMATAADLVIVGAHEIVDVGELDPNFVMTPGIFVDYVVGGEPIG
jgi:acetate CoA/acetoacetate CoA-transferase alpha subunit